MDWSGNLRVPLVSRPENSCSYLFNYNYDHFPGLEMKQPLMVQEHEMLPTLMLDKNNMNYNTRNHYRYNDLKKKRLSNEQLESLEKGFQEDIKLEPDRKMKLANELGLQPRQIAVWFQNRRARWKGKQLERLYDALKHEYDVVSMEKNKLQQEVLALRTIMREQVTRGNAELSGSQEAAESLSIVNSCNTLGDTSRKIQGPNNYEPNTDDYSSVVVPPIYWPTFPS